MPTNFPLVDVADIVRLVGKASFERGRAYSRNGAVQEVTWDADAQRLSGIVQGSEPIPYRCRVDLIATRNGYSRPTSSACSCPMDYDCKHVSATMLAGNAAHLQQENRAAKTDLHLAQERAGLPLTPLPHEAQDAAPAAPVQPDWKSAVSSLSASRVASVVTSNGGFPGDSAQTAPMGLQFELREQIPRPNERWRGPTVRTASSERSEIGTYRLGVRPVMRNSRGNWVRANLAWNNITYQLNRLNLEPAQHRWFCHFIALHRATREAYFGGGEADWVYLDDFPSPLLWTLFDDAAALGIRFAGSAKDAVVTIAREATVSLDASMISDAQTDAAGSGPAHDESPAHDADADDEPPTHDADAHDEAGLRLTTTLTVDGSQHPPEAAGTIGDHGVYAWELAPRTAFTLAPTAEPLSREQRRLLGRPSTVEIPSPDVGEFLSEYYPALRQSILVTSTDASVQFPEIEPPTLVLTATYRPKHTLQLEWAWEYRSGTAVTRHPMSERHGSHVAVGGVRDAAAEEKTQGIVAEILGAVPATSATLQGIDAAEFTEKTLPLFDGLDGVRVDVVGEQPEYRELTEAPKLTFTTVETDQRDWFDLGVIVTIEDKKVPFGPLFKALSTGKKKLLLIDNTYLSLSHPAFEQLKELIDEAGALDEWETGVRISRYQASLWEEFEDLAEETVEAQSWRDAVSGLNRLTSLETVVEPTPLPSGLTATMRPYQLDGFSWLAFLWKHGLGGVLADDMGLGKTLQTLALIAHAVELTTLVEPRETESLVEAGPTPPVPDDPQDRPAVSMGSETTTGSPQARSTKRGRDAASLAEPTTLVEPRETESQVEPGPTPPVPDDPQDRPAVSMGSETSTTHTRKPFLVVAPTSVVSNWLTESARFTPGLAAVGITTTQAKGRMPLAEIIAGADLVVTSYALFRLDFEAYQAEDWAGLILDEAQFVKNRAARVHICARELKAPFKLAITGTPMENNLMELWSLFAIVAPGLFPSARRFTEEYQRPIEVGDKGVSNKGEKRPAGTVSKADLLARLRRRIRPLMMRRTKDLVATELPAKQEQVLQIDLEPRHRKLYDTFLQRERQKLLGLLEDMDKNRFIVFRSLTLLRMLSLDASLVDEKYSAVPSSKLDALFEQLEDVVAEGHRALIFSQFTSFLGKAAARLDDLGVPYAYLDGSTRRRADVIKKFKDGEAPVFLISLKAGGFGLNLTEADYVFLLDPWWNPATEAQAVDRTHRIGQTKNVMVYRMVATGTIEEKVMALKDKKAKLFNAVMDDDAMFSSALTADDIRGLLDA